MLHSKRLVFSLFLLTLALAIAFSAVQGESNLLIHRITNTSEEGINLNPSISGDGRHIAFESTEDLIQSDSGLGFRGFRANISAQPPAFAQLARSRTVAPALSQDGARIAFASTEDLVGRNADRNSEIFLLDGATMRQITDTLPETNAGRLHDGCFQPSITDDGVRIAFSSNRNLAGLNPDLNSEVFLFDTDSLQFTFINTSDEGFDASNAKISGDGSHVAYIRRSSQSPSGSQDLVLKNLIEGQAQLIATNVGQSSLTYGPAISDDGLRVVYSAEIAEDQAEVFLYDDRFQSLRQVTSLPARTNDVPLYPALSGNGRRITFASRRDVVGMNKDHGVELYAFDVPSGQFLQLTDAPAGATAEVVSALSDDGTIAVFNFPRLLSGPTSSAEMANNSEIYTTTIPAPASNGDLRILSAAALGNEPVTSTALAPASMAIARGAALALSTAEGQLLPDGTFPLSLGGTTVTVNGRAATVLYVSPEEVHFITPSGTELGPAEILLTNADGYQSLGTVTFQKVAPGLFTFTGNGGGEALALNADTLVAGPFDPTNGTTRVTLFATGIRNSMNTVVLLGVSAITAEKVFPSPDLPGLDEIHFLIPSELRGLGTASLTVAGDNVESNPATITLKGDSLREIVLNELLTDPPDELAGDANHDGVRNSSDDEFVELVNSTTRDLDLSGYHLETTRSASNAAVTRHRFGPGTIFPAGTAIVVFGGGNPDFREPAFGGAEVVKASTGGLSLLNSGSIVALRNSTGVLVTFMAYGGSTGPPGNANQSLTRSPDLVGPFILHQAAPGSRNDLFSPGRRLSGDPFTPNPAISQILVLPGTTTLNPGEETQFYARALSENNQELSDVLFTWTTSEPGIAKIDQAGLATAIAPGSAQISASARGVSSDVSILTVLAPTPSPMPTVTPAPSPSPSPTLTPTPNPSPFPSPSPTPDSGGSIVISQIYAGGGNSGAPFRNDFIELFNRGTEAQSLDGWSVQYASATGSNWSITNLPPVTLAPGQYFLIQESSGGASGATLPPPDATGTITMAASAGIVALVHTTTALTGSCQTSPTVVDMVGYGTGANCFRGAGPTAAPGNTTAVLRKENGCMDTQDNRDDFATGTPLPRNTTVQANHCSIAADFLLIVSNLGRLVDSAGTDHPQLCFTCYLGVGLSRERKCHLQSFFER
ncbi:MAG TPA: lamin tail domain-containing protein [Pyrinomonadaceae bacterium]|nr:lamin tail domain-containing protein [Pyrinomonadaceae bacterium]